MMENLPDGWCTTKIGDVVDRVIQRKPNNDEQFFYIDIGSIDRDQKKIETPDFILGKDAPSRARKIINTGDVLVSLTRPNLNAVAYVYEKYNEQIASTGFDVLKPKIIDGKYLFALVRGQGFIESISKQVQGALYPAAKSSDVHNFEFNLPPLAEQQYIATLLDQHLAQVENIKTRLAAIPALLKKFRQSVLADAVSGKLTEDLRDNLVLSDNGFPVLWISKGLSELGTLARGKSKHRPRNDPRLFGTDYPFIQTGEITNSNGSILDAHKFYSAFGLQQSKLFAVDTLCITIAANIADTAILKIEACFPDSIVGFTPNAEICNVTFVKYLIDVNKENLEHFAPATAQKNINLKVLNSLNLPIPPLEEQTEIVRRVEQLFAHADHIEKSVLEAQKRVNNLTQSILAKAFSGQLTAAWREQNPDLISGDNSAAKLLERIQLERKANSNRTKKTKGVKA